MYWFWRKFERLWDLLTWWYKPTGQAHKNLMTIRKALAEEGLPNDSSEVIDDILQYIAMNVENYVGDHPQHWREIFEELEKL